MNRVIVYIGGRSIVYVGSRSIVYVDSVYAMYGGLYVDSLYVSRSICFLLKFSCASFVWVRLENLPFLEVELNTESFISLKVSTFSS